MRHARRWSCVFLTFLILFVPETLTAAISITASGSWSETVDALDLQTGAGSDLVSSYESPSTAVTIDITGTTGNGDNWRVDVSKTDATWDGSLLLDVKRTTSGTGTGSISGGTSYQEVSGTDQSFFSGSGDRTDLKIQLQLRGMSVQVSPDTYSTTVFYTVVDTV